MIPLKDESPTRTIAFINAGIILFNVVIFFYELSFGSYMKTLIYAFGAIPYEILHNVDLNPLISFPVQYTVFTSMFMHGGKMHLIGNMLYLWIFGNKIEDEIGHVKFLIFYVTCGIIAALAHALTNINSQVPMVGASGAVSGILGAYMILYPRAKILTVVILGFFFRIVKIPAIIVIGIWIFFQIINSIALPTPGRTQQVAWFAHIGGFLAGILLIKSFQSKWIFRGKK